MALTVMYAVAEFRVQVPSTRRRLGQAAGVATRTPQRPGSLAIGLHKSSQKANEMEKMILVGGMSGRVAVMPTRVLVSCIHRYINH